jgi:hypothetical protein
MEYIEIKADDDFIANLVKNSQNSFSIEEINIFRSFIESKQSVYFEKDSFGIRISENKGLLRTLFSPFIYRKNFLSIEKFKGILCYATDGKENIYKINMILDNPIYLLEKGAYFESDLDEDFFVKYIKEYMEKNHNIKIYQVDYDYSIDITETEKIYIRDNFKMKIKDLSILVDSTSIRKKRSFPVSGELFLEMLIYSGKYIDANNDNKKILTKIIKRSGVVPEVFDSGIQFTKSEIKNILIPNLIINKYNKNETLLAAIRLIETQNSADGEIVSNIIGKFNSDKNLSKMLKNSKKIFKKFKDDPATLLLITIM